jgi:uroporphyrinogen-III decarboxylase
MTDAQWETLRKVIRGEKVDPAPVGFIIDCPWLPNWNGTRIVDYFSNDAVWLAANLKAVKEFPDVMFLPGFWSEYGMCTEPSAFGARCAFPANEFPHAHKVIDSMDDIDSLVDPDPRTDGLLPFVLNRLVMAKGPMADAGHQVRIAVARGPLNIASYLMGSTEFLTMMMMYPEKAHNLLDKICSFLANWIDLQRKTFPSIGGLLLLDDIIGFLGEAEFLEFAMPCFQKLYTKDLEVRFLHNDAPCKVSAPFLTQMGVNLYNPGIDVSLTELRALAGPELTILGNLPPRDVLAAGTPETVEKETRAMVASISDRSRIIFSAGGGMPPGVSTANINAFMKAVRATA